MTELQKGLRLLVSEGSMFHPGEGEERLHITPFTSRVEEEENCMWLQMVTLKCPQFWCSYSLIIISILCINTLGIGALFPEHVVMVTVLSFWVSNNVS